MKSKHPTLAWPVLTFLALILLTLHLLSDAVQNSTALSSYFMPLLILTLGALLILAALITLNLFRLVSSYRKQVVGSRLAGRLLVLFAALSLAPVSILYYYSMQFLNQGVDSWFDVAIDRVMENALELSQASLGLNQRTLLKFTAQMLAQSQDQSHSGRLLSLERMRQGSGAIELVLLDRNGTVLAFSHPDPTRLVPELPGTEILQQLKTGDDFVGLRPGPAGDLQIRVGVIDPESGFSIHGIFPTSEHISYLSRELETAYNRYRELAFLRQSLKFSFILVLSLMLMFSLLAALWVALRSSLRLVAPLGDLAAGTKAVAEGIYDQRLPMPSHKDEFAVLVQSFNLMTRRLERARRDATESRLELEHQHQYLETVLGRLSSGVMTFDRDYRLKKYNPAAETILDSQLHPLIDRPSQELRAASPRLAQLMEQVCESARQRQGDWRAEITLSQEGPAQILMCRSTPLGQAADETGGYVLVFDDITALIHAQRDAAWGEVARRMAHEIKNPLTPIQLSAERLRRKYLHSLPEEDAKVLDRATHTIVEQVEALKAMVNAFSDYARPPRMESRPLLADQVFQEVLDLYGADREAGRLRTALQAGAVRIEADPGRLRQVLHNLVKNALEAIQATPEGQVRVTSGIEETAKGFWYELLIDDNGPGFNTSVFGHLFEPYVTTKKKGSGLGLAIVKKIVEEHGGTISAEQLEPGARMRVRLPFALG